MKYTLLFFFSFIFINGNTQTTRNLHENWTFKQEGTEKWMAATVPGVVHLDLLDNKVIEDPYFGNNEQKQQWIENETWTYKTTISLTEEELKAEHLELEFEGLDTYASVTLNGKDILSANNMFRSWTVDVTGILTPSANELIITFKSPIKTHLTTLADRPYELPAANETVDVKVSPYVRKAAYQFGWDWGPRFVTAGIWRPVHLKSWNSAKITSVQVTAISITKEKAEMSLEFQLFSDSDRALIVTEKNYGIQSEEQVKKGENTLNYKFNIENPKVWKSRSKDRDKFYTYELEISDINNPIGTHSDRFSIRKIDLIHEADSIGTSFYFKLNDEPIFIKGANYIPQDAFLPRVDSSRYEKLIQQAYDLGVNMLRVWGGGIYENEYFYDLCDEYGILVWQDFMFANSMYPKDEAFLKNVKEEVRENIERLRHHPSIAIWCGNNEIQIAWENWGWQKQYGYSKADSAEIIGTYHAIFHEMIPNAVKNYDSSRPYTTTTPLSNWGTPKNFNHATMHYWGVWHGREPIENFAKNIGRFNTEYGYQSFPSAQTLLTAMNASDLDLDSEIMKNRQKSYIGNGIIAQNVKKYAYSEEDFAKWCILTQKVQAHAMGYAIRQHRINSPHCMGTMFWQLNDCWPAPTWSVIDYYGNEKEGYHDIQRDFSPVIAHIEKKGGKFELTLVSDLLAKTIVTVKVDAITSKDKTSPLFEGAFELSPLRSQTITFDKIKEKKWCKKKQEMAKSHVQVRHNDQVIFEAVYDVKNNSFTSFELE